MLFNLLSTTWQKSKDTSAKANQALNNLSNLVIKMLKVFKIIYHCLYAVTAVFLFEV